MMVIQQGEVLAFVATAAVVQGITNKQTSNKANGDVIFKDKHL